MSKQGGEKVQSAPRNVIAAVTGNKPMTEQEAKLLRTFAIEQNKFSLRLLSDWCKGDAGNVALSGPSIWCLTAMAANGASPAHAQPFNRVLGIEGNALPEVNTYANALLSYYGRQPELSLATSAWVFSRYRLDDAFVKFARRQYFASVETIDFTGRSGLQQVNGWASKATRGKINQVLSSLDPDGLAVLVSAAYLKAAWKKPFEKELTKSKPFRNGSIETQVMMMHQSGKYFYKSIGTWEAVQLPYRSDSLSMFAVLPAKGKSVQDVTRDLTAGDWDEVRQGFEYIKGSVSIPRFKIEYNSADVAGLLKKFGGSDQLMLDKIIEVPVPVTNVIHRAVVEVNEEGTEAAAATAMALAASAPPPDEKTFNFVADRPFLFFLVDQTTNLNFFAGAVNQPK